MLISFFLSTARTIHITNNLKYHKPTIQKKSEHVGEKPTNEMISDQQPPNQSIITSEQSLRAESAVDWSKSESASLTECAKHADGSIDTHINISSTKRQL